MIVKFLKNKLTFYHPPGELIYPPIAKKKATEQTTKLCCCNLCKFYILGKLFKKAKHRLRHHFLATAHFKKSCCPLSSYENFPLDPDLIHCLQSFPPDFCLTWPVKNGNGPSRGECAHCVGPQFLIFSETKSLVVMSRHQDCKGNK